jgi:hypothetical protein
MAIGIVVGTYSSVFIASPTLLLLERRFGGATAPTPAPAAAAGAAAGTVPDAAFAVRHDAPPRRDAGSRKAKRKKKKRR